MQDKVKLIPKDKTVTPTVAVRIPEYLWKFISHTREHFKPEHGEPGPLCLFHARVALHALSQHEAGSEYGVSTGRMMVSFMNCFDQFSDSLPLDEIINAKEIPDDMPGEEVYVFSNEDMRLIAKLVHNRMYKTENESERDRLVKLFEKIHGGKPWPPLPTEESSAANDD